MLLSGFGTEDTHHIIHTFRWGPDGMLYFNQSIYIHSHIETPHGVRRLNGGGIWQFRPETGRLDVFARGFVNPWGHDFDRWGQSFATDGADGEGINYVVPGARSSVRPTTGRRTSRDMLKGLNPGSRSTAGWRSSAAGTCPTTGRAMSSPTTSAATASAASSSHDDGQRLRRARQAEDVIKTSHPAFRPIDVKMGPDGAIYIADWYNPIIQHGEVDFRDPRRDHTHGRIWRITAKGRPLVPKPKLVGASVDELFGNAEGARGLDARDGEAGVEGEGPHLWGKATGQQMIQRRIVAKIKNWTKSASSEKCRRLTDAYRGALAA